MAIAAGPFPWASSPWQEAQYFRKVTFPAATLVCPAVDFFSVLPCARTMPRAVINAKPDKITFEHRHASLGRFKRICMWCTTGVVVSVVSCRPGRRAYHPGPSRSELRSGKQASLGNFHQEQIRHGRNREKHKEQPRESRESK